VDLTVATGQLTALMLASVRAAAWLAVCPPFNGRSLPTAAKGLLSVGIALPVAPHLVDKVPSVNSPLLIVSFVEQVIVGVSLGFITSLLFAAIAAAGNLIDVFGGFSVAPAFDPMSMATNTVFGRFYEVTASTLLFATNGHQLVLRGFTSSYRSLPLDGTLSMDALQHLLTTGLSQMFVSALQIAGPLIAVLFCTDIGLGLLTRVAPALNAFSLSFPAKILLTLSAVGAALVLLPRHLEGIVDQAVRAVLRAIGG
jgi:flagellar biosynthetic protein FliR